MRRLERADDLQEALLVAQRGHQATIWTALPGVIKKFDATKMTAEVKPAMQVRVTKESGYHEWLSLPMLVDCPVIFPSGGGFTLTFPIAVGDECLVIFASRCIDSWWQQGMSGEAPQPAEIRMHDLSDGFVLPGPRSVPRVLPAFNTTCVELRSDSGASFLRLDPAGAMTITATSLTVNGPTTVNGAFAAGGGGFTHNGVNVGSTHKHKENEVLNGLTGVPE